MKRRFLSALLACLLTAALVVPASAAVYHPDLADHWAEQTIDQAAFDGWVTGYPDGTFRPEGTITRAEFVKMLLAATKVQPGWAKAEWMKAHAVDLDTGAPYTPALADMDNHWLTQQGWTEAALYTGLVVPTDYYGGLFGPDTPITRNEIAVLVVRALGLVYPAERDPGDGLAFPDREDIPAWARGYVSQAVGAGVLEGYPDGTFGPGRTATRAEAVVMVSRMLDTMTEGANADIRVRVQYEAHRLGLLTSPKELVAQVVDGVIYVSVQDMLNLREALAENVRDFSFLPSESYPESPYKAKWYPLDQEVFFMPFEPGDFYYFQAGNDRAVMAGGMRHPVLDDQDLSLGAPCRMLYGRVMMPLYDLNDPARITIPWDTTWDKTSRTLAVQFGEVHTPLS